jgi:hypothetical protein
MGHYVVTPNLKPIFEWYVARLEVENMHQNDMCYIQVEQYVQNIS